MTALAPVANPQRNPGSARHVAHDNMPPAGVPLPPLRRQSGTGHSYGGVIA
jgi:hypothetical protein